jgi:hypothetical protein
MLWDENECGKPKVIRISRQPSPVQVMINQNQGENVEYFNCLGSMMTNEARCGFEIKLRIAMAKPAFNKKTFHQQIERKLGKKLVNCCMWSIAFYGAETWTPVHLS